MEVYTNHLKRQDEHRLFMTLSTPDKKEIQKLNGELLREELEMRKAEVKSTTLSARINVQEG